MRSRRPAPPTPPQAGDDIEIRPFTTVAVAEAWCGAHDTCQGFTFDTNASAPGRSVYFKAGVVLGGGARGWASYIKAANAPPAYGGGARHQVWVKRLGAADAAGGAPVAVLCVNAGPANTTADFTAPLAELGILVGASVRDIWVRGPSGWVGLLFSKQAGMALSLRPATPLQARRDGPAIEPGGRLTVTGVPGHSSRFFKLTPSAWVPS